MGYLGSMKWKMQTQHFLHFAQKDMSFFLSVYLGANKIVCKGITHFWEDTCLLVPNVCKAMYSTQHKKILKEIETTSDNQRNLNHKSNV